MYFRTDGEYSIADVSEKVEELGFESALGPTDFIYDWKDKEPTKEDLFKLGDKLIETLKDSKVTFNLDTHN